MKLHAKSIKRRLLALVLVAIALTWLVAAGLTYMDARHELDEVLDEHLEHAASLLLAQVKHELDEHGLAIGLVLELHKYSRRTAFQVWDKNHQLLLHSSNASQEPLTNDATGFSSRIIQGHVWRVYSTWDDSGEYLISMAERMDVREDLAHGIAVNLLRPLLVTLPLLAILLWLAINNGLRPVVTLTREIGLREPDNLAPLDTGSAPKEIMPLIKRLNHLFARIGTSIENERRFTADAAHELRTPVAAIKAQTQVARSASSEAARVHALDNAVIGCDRATHLIEQLLTLARLDIATTDGLEHCPLRAMTSEVMAELVPAALDKKVQLELMDGAEISINGLPALLRIMLRNLLDNAVRHTPEGTMVHVEIYQNGSPCIAISDNGPGLPPEDLEKLSQRFYRPLGTAADGSGLGLSIVRRIAEIHGAKLEFTPTRNAPGLRIAVSFDPH